MGKIYETEISGIENSNDSIEMDYGDKNLFWNRDAIETNEEIRGRLHKLGVENVDLKGTKGIWQKQIAESMESMYEKYPELQGFISSVRTVKLPEGVFACAGPKMTKNGFAAEIQFSEDLFSKSNLEWKIVDMETENYAGERWFAGRGLDGVIKHEMGHALHLKMIVDSEGVNTADLSQIKFEHISEKYNRNAIVTSLCYNSLEELEISPKDIGKNLSVYGASDFGEFFAEAISEYETAKKPRPIAVKIHEKYEEYKRNKEEAL